MVCPRLPGANLVSSRDCSVWVTADCFPVPFRRDPHGVERGWPREDGESPVPTGPRLRMKMNTHCGLRLSETHPLNLSISISGGRETNRDSLSNGERSGNKPRSEISRSGFCYGPGELWSGEADCPDPLLSSPKLTWNGTPERVRAP